LLFNSFRGLPEPTWLDDGTVLIVTPSLPRSRLAAAHLSNTSNGYFEAIDHSHAKVWVLRYDRVVEVKAMGKNFVKPASYIPSAWTR